MAFIHKKQDESDQATAREESFIQNSSWCSVRSEKRANFLCIRIQIGYLVGYLTSRLQDFAALCWKFWVLRFDKKSSIKQYLLNISLLKHDIWQEESMEWALNLHVAAPCLDSQFALLQKIVVLVTWKLVLSLLRHPLFSEQIIL